MSNAINTYGLTLLADSRRAKTILKMYSQNFNFLKQGRGLERLNIFAYENYIIINNIIEKYFHNGINKYTYLIPVMYM